LGHKAKWEYFRAIYERYHKAGREAKQLMLNEFCLNTGYHRKYAIRLLNGPPPGKQPERRARNVDHRITGTKYFPFGGDLGSGRISLVGAAEGLAAEVDALDSQALSNQRADGETTTGQQCSTNRPALAERRASTNGVSTDAPNPALC
jgi:hypothetical protein